MRFRSNPLIRGKALKRVLCALVRPLRRPGVSGAGSPWIPKGANSRPLYCHRIQPRLCRYAISEINGRREVRDSARTIYRLRWRHAGGTGLTKSTEAVELPSLSKRGEQSTIC
jgi:hypothetical protein